MNCFLLLSFLQPILQISSVFNTAFYFPSLWRDTRQSSSPPARRGRDRERDEGSASAMPEFPELSPEWFLLCLLVAGAGEQFGLGRSEELSSHFQVLQYFVILAKGRC